MALWESKCDIGGVGKVARTGVNDKQRDFSRRMRCRENDESIRRGS